MTNQDNDLALLAEGVQAHSSSDEIIGDEDALTEADGIETALPFNVYGEIKIELLKRGVCPDHIAFIQDYNTKTRRAALFAAMNRGDIRVLVLSKQSTGINVQQRLIALHNLDVPWRPGDVEQRIGRIQRQGNIWPEIYVFNHATEASLDGYRWQGILTKSQFIHQFESGDVTTREIDDIGGMVVSAAEMRAIASGNPAIIEKMKLENEASRLDVSFAGYRDELINMRRSLGDICARRESLRKDVERLAQIQSIIDAHPQEEGKFKVAIVTAFNDHEGRVVTNREDAGAAVRGIVEEGFTLLKAAHQEAVKAAKSTPIFGKAKEPTLLRSIEPIEWTRTLASYRGLFVQFWLTTTRMGDMEYRLQLMSKDAETMHPVSRGLEISTQTDKGVFQSIDHAIRDIESRQKRALKDIEGQNAEEATVNVALAQPWEFEQRYAEVRATLRRVNASLGIDHDGGTEADEDVPVVEAPRRASRRSRLHLGLTRRAKRSSALGAYRRWCARAQQRNAMVYPEIIIPPPSDPTAMAAARQKLLAMDAARVTAKQPVAVVSAPEPISDDQAETITLEAEDVILPTAIITERPLAEPQPVAVPQPTVPVPISPAAGVAFGDPVSLEKLRAKKTKKAALMAASGQLSLFDTTPVGGQTSMF